MKFRAYGYVKDSKTNDVIRSAIIKIYLNEEELQKGESVENGFYEVIVDIEDSRIESGQQLRVTIEKEGYKIQEHLVLTTEKSFNLDVKLEKEPKKPFPWLPVIIAGGAVILLLVVGLIVLLFLLPKAPKITSFSADPNSIESGQSATLSWETKKASSVEILIDQNIVRVDLSGSKQVQPIQTTEYILIAKNDKGEARESQSVEVKDIIPPELTMNFSPLAPTTEEKVIFTATASDPGGISKMEILVNGTKVTECDSSPCTCESGPYALGSVSYEAYAWDKSGNKAVTGSMSFTVRDIGPPDVTITLNPSSPTTEEKVTFTATASDPGGIGKMEILVNGTKVTECDSSPCTFTGGPYPPVSISYEARAYDKSGNSAAAGPNTFTTKDIDDPIVTITHSPLKPTIDEKVIFTATATDPGGIRNVQIYVNGSKAEECSGSPCKYIGGPYSLGSVKYEARAWDMSNQSAVDGPKSFTTRDIMPPKTTITSNPTSPTTTQKVTFTATATDPGGIKNIQIYVNGKKLKECDSSPCTCESGPYALGTVSYYAYAYDKSGNKASTGSKTTTILDKTPPNVSITTNPFTVNLNKRVTFTASASDTGGIKNVHIYVNGKRVKECTGSPCSSVGGPYGLGNLVYEAYAWDKAGNKKHTGRKTLTVMNFDFESGNLTGSGWTKSGTAFNYQPTFGDNPTMRHRGQPSNHQGNYWIGTFEKHPTSRSTAGATQGDGPTGTLTSMPFVIQSDKASFLVGGGSGRAVGVKLIVDGNTVRDARGKNTETMTRETWDLKGYENKIGKLVIFDNATGAWGHINFDDFQFVPPIRLISPFRFINTTKPPIRTYIPEDLTVAPRSP